MALRFPGTRGIRYDQPTPQIRLDATTEDTFPTGVAGGRWQVSVWIRPLDVNVTREILMVLDAITATFGACFFTLRLEGGFAAGTLIVIMQSGLFGFCTVRRSNAGAITQDVWQHIFVEFDLNSADCHVYLNGVEISYAFSRSETLLPPYGGSYIMVGSTIDGHDGGPVYARGVRIASGDPGNADPAKQFTTTMGRSFYGDIAAPGIWHGGVFVGTGGLANFITMMADGYSPLFLPHRFEGSLNTHGIIWAPPLMGEVITEEADPFTGAIPVIESGTGAIEAVDGPGIMYPADPDEPGPGVPLPTRPRLCLPFGMPRAEIYSNPGNPADILPVVYGDFRVGGIRGAIPAILIDKGTDDLGPWVYCAAFHPVVSLDDVYIGDVRQTTGFTVATSENFQNQGTIARITFTTQPEDVVSWRGRGVFAEDGVTVMENAIDQVVHLLTTFGNFDEDVDFEATSLAAARAAVTALDYRTAFVVRNEQVTQDWLTEMLFNVMGQWRVNGLEQVEFRVDDGSDPGASDISAFLTASRDCLDGDDGVTFTIDRRWLVNDLRVNFGWGYSLGQPSFRARGLTDTQSVEAYGEMVKEVTLIGIRRLVDVITWSVILLIRQSGRTRVEGGQVTLTVFAARVAHLTVGDLICVTWPYGPTREGGRPYANEICRVVDLVLDPARGGAVTITAVDLGVYLTGPDGTRELEPWPA